MQWSKIKTLTLIMCILPVTFLSGATKKNQALTLVDNGICNVSIHNIAAGAPSTVEIFAAEELQAAFKLASGTAPPINPALAAAIQIRLGVSNQFAESVANSNEQAYTVRRTNDGHIELVGNCKAAVMWAVDDFCKEVLRVSWPVSTDVMMLQGKPRSTVTIEQLYKLEAPDFPVRGWLVGANIDGYHYSDSIGKWMAHNRMNTVHNLKNRMEEGGGYAKMLARGIDVDTTMHDYCVLIPSSLYYDDVNHPESYHPEYFPLIDGKRVRPVHPFIFIQLCLSNPDVRNIIIDKMDQFFKDYPDIKVFGVGQNDGGVGWCQCAPCVAMDGAQAGTGLYSNRVIKFINYLADAIGPNHPGKYVGTFGGGTPPDIDVADNVSVTLILTMKIGNGNYMRNLTDPTDPGNANAMKDIKGWLSKTKNVHFWAHYWTTSMDSCLTPYARTTAVETFRDLKKLGFQGFVGETRPPYWPSQRILFYAMARICWDSSLTYDEILDDYCNEAYGPAASAMKSFHLLYEDRIYKHVPVLLRDGACGQLFPAVFSSADMDALEGFLASAEAATAGGFQGNIDVIAEVRGIFEKFKAISTDPADIPGIGPNLILNPGAEDGSANWVSNIFMNRGEYAFSTPTDRPRSGSKSFKVEWTGGEDVHPPNAARWIQSIPVVPGKKYAARFWIRASGNAYGRLEISSTPVGWTDSGDKWVQLVLPEFTATGSTLTLYPTSNGGGTVYFDDFFVAELP